VQRLAVAGRTARRFPNITTAHPIERKSRGRMPCSKS
jgi:hypothetical protein